MANEAFMWAKEPSFGTWTTPTKAAPVRTVNLTGNQPLMIPEETGIGRNDLPGSPGEISVGPGDITGNLRPSGLIELLASMFQTRVAAAAGTGFRNKLLINDDVDTPTYSFQKKYRSNFAESIRGAKITGFTISARAREFAQITLNFVAKDSTVNGGTWSDGAAGPAVIGTVPYAAVIPESFKFYQAVMRLGGTVSLTAGELVVAGGTARNDLDNIELTGALNVGTDAYGINLGDRTLQSLDEGRREINVRFDPNFALSDTSFYNAWKSGARAVLELYFEGPIYAGTDRYQLKFTLPWVVYGEGGNPEINSSYGLKRHTINGRAFIDPTAGIRRDIGLVIQSTEDLTAV